MPSQASILLLQKGDLTILGNGATLRYQQKGAQEIVSPAHAHIKKSPSFQINKKRGLLKLRQGQKGNESSGEASISRSHRGKSEEGKSVNTKKKKKTNTQTKHKK